MKCFLLGCMFFLLTSLAIRAEELHWDFENPGAYTYPTWGVGGGWHVHEGDLQNIHPESHENLMGSISTPPFRFIPNASGAGGFVNTNDGGGLGHGASDLNTVISIDNCDCTGGDETKIQLIRLDTFSQIIETLFTQDDPPGPVSRVLSTAEYPDLVSGGTYSVRFSTLDYDNPSAYIRVSNLRITNAVIDVLHSGDFNEDGAIDAADYTVWRDNRGTDFNLNGNGDEDGASAGIVDAADYQLWKANFGKGKLDPSAVPEPPSCVLFLSMIAFRRLRRRSTLDMPNKRVR